MIKIHAPQWTVCALSLILVFLLTACITQKKLYTTGKQQMEMGMYDEAAETLIRALNKKKSNVEVQLALRNCAVIVFEQKTDHIAEAYQSGQLQEVISSYHYLGALQNRLKEVGVIIEMPVRAMTFYNQSKETVNEQRNAVAQKELIEKNYSNAERLFRDILHLDPNHTDAQAGLIIAVNQPILDKGIDLYEKDKYKAAYEQFKKISRYKNAADLINLSLEKGRARYLLVPEDPIKNAFFNTIVEELINNRESPFLDPVTYKEYSSSMEKYGIKFKDLIYYSPTTKALHDLGKFTAIVQFTTLNSRIEKTVISKQKIKGYHETIVENKKSDGTKERKITYKKVYYTIVKSTTPQQVISKIGLRMIHPLDGRMLLSKDCIRTDAQELYYIEYEGDLRNLKAGNWAALNLPFIASKDKIYEENHSENRLIKSLLKAKRTLSDPVQIQVTQQKDIRKELISYIVKASLKD